MQDLVAGQIDMMITSTTDVIPQARAGTIKALACRPTGAGGGAARNPHRRRGRIARFLHPDVARALGAGRARPRTSIAQLNAAAVEALADPAVRKRLANIDQDIPPREQQTPEALGAHHKAEIEKWWPIIKAAEIKPE